MPVLNPGDPFPALAVTTSDSQNLQLPDALAGRFGVILFYRGAWCPYCNAQLRSFQRAQDRLSEVGANVVALSVDGEQATKELIAEHGLTFPIGHDADAKAIAAATGAFVNPDPVHSHMAYDTFIPPGASPAVAFSSKLRMPALAAGGSQTRPGRIHCDRSVQLCILGEPDAPRPRVSRRHRINCIAVRWLPGPPRERGCAGAAQACAHDLRLPSAAVADLNVTLADMGMTQMMSGPAPVGAHMMLRSSPASVAAGQVSLVASNLGWRTHELVVLPLAAGAVAGRGVAGPDGKVAEAGSLGEASGSCAADTGNGIGSGEVGWVTVTLAPGNYELVCNLPNHYPDGMYQEFVVI